jgi:hypothetical protein
MWAGTSFSFLGVGYRFGVGAAQAPHPQGVGQGLDYPIACSLCPPCLRAS